MTNKKNSPDNPPVYNYDIIMVFLHCDNLSGFDKKINYLNFVKNHKLSNNPFFDKYNGQLPFEKQIDDKIEELILLNKLSQSPDTSKNNFDSENSVVKIISKYGYSDIVRIFEAMKSSGIISDKTEVPQIVNIFFNDPVENQKKADSYYATKSNIFDESIASSRSDNMMLFIKRLIETSFGNNKKKLSEIYKFTDDLYDKAPPP